MERLARNIDTLARLAAKLKPARNDQPIINDMFEAADDWRNLGNSLLKDNGHNLSGRVQQEEELVAALQAFYGKALQQDLDYAAVMDLGGQIIAEGKQRKYDPDGYLGSVKIVRETFAFLQSEFGLVPGQELRSLWNYKLDRVCVSLSLPSEYDWSCRVKRLIDQSTSFDLEDLLFMAGRSVSLALPPGQAIASLVDVQAWFTTVADILRQYGSDVLADRPGAFERLAQAEAERERLQNEENERLYGLGAADGLGPAD